MGDLTQTIWTSVQEFLTALAKKIPSHKNVSWETSITHFHSHLLWNLALVVEPQRPLQATVTKSWKLEMC